MKGCIAELVQVKTLFVRKPLPYRVLLAKSASIKAGSAIASGFPKAKTTTG